MIQINARDPACAGRQKKAHGPDLRQSPAPGAGQGYGMWQQIATAPFDADIELAVMDSDGAHALVFPCRRILGGWMNAETKERLEVHPTHWRGWQARPKDGAAA